MILYLLATSNVLI